MYAKVRIFFYYQNFSREKPYISVYDLTAINVLVSNLKMRNGYEMAFAIMN